MVYRHYELAAGLLVALLISSCASAESRLVGRWESESGNGYLELQADRGFTWSLGPMTQRGTWRVQERTLRLTVESTDIEPAFLGEGTPARNGTAPSEGEFNPLQGIPRVEMIYDYRLTGGRLVISLPGTEITYRQRRSE